MSRIRTTYGAAILALLTLLFLLGSAGPVAYSQDRNSVLRIQALEGEATIERVYEAVYPATLNEVVAAGDRLKTGANSRVELSLGNGLFVRVDGQSFLEVTALDGTDQEGRLLLRLFYGSVYIDTQAAETVQFSAPSRVRLDTPDGSVWAEEGALLRVDVDPEQGTHIRVIFGRAEVLHPQGQLTVFPGQALYGMRPDRLPAPLPETTAYMDAFDQWNEYRRSYYTVYANNEDYLPPELRYEGMELYRYGRWRRHPSYGYIWLPPVQGAWFPYYQGYWTWAGDWIWIPFEPWGWVTHHYGFWTYDTAWGWAWVPHARFRFAWVTWYDAGGFLGWCPLTVGYRPLTLIHIEINRIYQIFPVNYVDPHGRPWIFIRRSFRPATPVLKYRVKELKPSVLTRGRIVDDFPETPWTLGWVSRERLQARGYEVRDKRLIPRHEAGAIVKVRPSTRDLETLRMIRKQVAPDVPTHRRLETKPVNRERRTDSHRDRDTIRNIRSQPGSVGPRPVPNTGRPPVDRRYKTKPVYREGIGNTSKDSSGTRAIRSQPGPLLRRPSPSTGPQPRPKFYRRPRTRPQGTQKSRRSGSQRRLSPRASGPEGDRDLNDRAPATSRRKSFTRETRESPIRSFMKGLQRMIRPRHSRPAAPSIHRPRPSKSRPTTRSRSRTRSVRPTLRRAPRSSRKATRPARKKKP